MGDAGAGHCQNRNREGEEGEEGKQYSHIGGDDPSQDVGSGVWWSPLFYGSRKIGFPWSGR